MTRHVRGTHISNVISYVRSKKGITGLEEMWEQLEKKRGKTKREYSQNEFVEYDLLLDLFQAVEDLFGTGPNETRRSREIGKHIVENLGHFEYLLRAEGFKELLEKAQEGIRQVYDFGKLELAEWEDNRAVIRYHDFPADENICSYFQGSLEKDLEMLGLKGNIEHTRCPAHGGEFIEFIATWE